VRLALILVLLAAAATTAPAEDREASMEYGGRSRWWLIHEPAGKGKVPRPLVIALHGGGGSPDGSARMTGLDALADREGFVAVYPAGTGFFGRRLLTWNAGNCCGYAMKKDVDDVGFLAALIAKYVKDGSADPKRVYMTGMSNGAMMTQRFACERADLVAAVAPVAGTIGVPRCEPSRPVSVLMINGRADQHVPYAGGEGMKMLSPRADRSAKQNVETWAKNDSCGAAETQEGRVSRESYRCPGGVDVVLLTHEGGHIWPGGKAGARNGNVDPVLADPKATETMWDFFKSHPGR
jgi:polyhydroxybutyrate depolymerase